MVWQSALGILVLTGVAWVLSENRSRVSWKTVAAGLGLQIGLALLLLKVPVFQDFFLALNDAVLSLQEATKTGTGFVFGYLGGGDLPFDEKNPGSSFVLAFQALPLMLVVSALSALLFHWRVLPVLVRGVSLALQRTMGVGGAVGISAAANVFVGMVEAPLLIRPYLQKLSRAELFMVMTVGMATVAGTVLVLYATFLSRVVPDAMGHVLTASLVSVPAALMVSKLMIPDDGVSTEGDYVPPDDIRSSMEAVSRGTADGVQLLIHVVAMLLVLVALVSLANQVLSLLPDAFGAPLSLERALGWVMAPMAWLMGIPWAEAHTAGGLLGVKVVINELIAYLQLSGLPEDALGERSRIILAYGLCGFANFGSLGIMLGGLTAMAPERRRDIVGLGMKSIVSGTLTTCLTGAVVGLLLW